MFVNKCFPLELRQTIKDLASDINSALALPNGDGPHLRYALDLASKGRTPFSAGLVEDIFRLCDLVGRAYATPDGRRWVEKARRAPQTTRRSHRTDSSDSSSSARPRRREEPSSGRGKAKRATFSGTSDSDSGQQHRHAGRDKPSNRQVTPRIYHAAEKDSDAPSFPPRIARRREHVSRLPSRETRVLRHHDNETRAETSVLSTPSADSPPSIQHMVEAITAAAITAIDRHLACIGFYPPYDSASSHNAVNTQRPRAHPAPVVAPPPRRVPWLHPRTPPRPLLETPALERPCACSSAPTVGGFRGPNHEPRRGPFK